MEGKKKCQAAMPPGTSDSTYLAIDRNPYRAPKPAVQLQVPGAPLPR
jgi:hypothetical protein